MKRQPRIAARIQTQADGQMRGALYLYDEIGGWLGILPRDVAARLAELRIQGATSLDVYINSPGGDYFDSAAIHSEISRWNHGEKICHVDGLCASGASLIAMAGDRVRIAPLGMFMVHNAWGRSVGDARALRKDADTLDALSKLMVEAYSRGTGLEPARVIELLDAETYMNAAQAVELGFADEIVDGEASEPLPASLLAPAEVHADVRDRSFINRLPEAALAAWRRTQPQVGGRAAENKEEEMNEHLIALLATLGLSADATAEQTAAVAARLKLHGELASTTINELGLKAEATAKDITVAVLELKRPATTDARVAELEAEAKNLRADLLVTKAQAEGKITAVAGDVEWARKYALTDPDGFERRMSLGAAIVPTAEVQARETKQQAKKAKLSEADLLVCKQLGVTEEEYLKYSANEEEVF